jgi:hypothetical protein
MTEQGETEDAEGECHECCHKFCGELKASGCPAGGSLALNSPPHPPGTLLEKQHSDLLSKYLAVQGELKKVKKELAILRKQPAPAKGVLRSVSKAQDLIDHETETDIGKQAAILSKLSPTDRAVELTKIIHGGR